MQATRGPAAIPSLLADESGARHPAARFGLLAELEGQREVGRTSPARLVGRLRTAPWPAVAASALAVLVMALLLLPDSPDLRAGADAQRDPPPARVVASGDGPRRPPAVILDEPPPSRLSVGESRAEPAGGAEGDPMQMLREDVVQVAAPVARRRAPAKSDSDVDLLAALVHHAGRMAPIAGMPATRPVETAPTTTQGPSPEDAEDRLAAVSQALAGCPAANTEAGLACRQAACTDRWGAHPSCPRPSAAAPRSR